jgi:hypothetical protein
MGLLDKAKAAAEQATTMAKEGAHELQVKRDLSGEYSALGKLAFELYEEGDLTHPKLEEKVERIRALRAELAADNGQVEPESAAPSDQPPADQEPATPT